MSITSAVDDRPVELAARNVPANQILSHLDEERLARAPPEESRRSWAPPVA
jgi:hypothetical protein